MKKTAIVTGTSRGIGEAIAKKLAIMEFSVALLGRDSKALTRVASEIQAARGYCVPMVCDVSQLESIEATLEKVDKILGLPTVLVNNAGLGGAVIKLIKYLTKNGIYFSRRMSRAFFGFAAVYYQK